MSAPTNYRELARECVREAEAAKDAGRKQTLLGIARLYNQTALSLEAGDGAEAPSRTSPEAAGERSGDLSGQGPFSKRP